MDADDARRMAQQLADAFPNGPRAYVWANDLRDLNIDHARTAFADMRQHADRGHLLPQFHAYYRAARVADAGGIEHPPAHCEQCDGHGWVTAPPILVGTGEGEMPYSQTVPCRCHPAGTRARAQLAKFAAVNGWKNQPEPEPDKPEAPALFGDRT